MTTAATYAGYRRVSQVNGRPDYDPVRQAAEIEAYARAQGFAIDMREPELDVTGSTLSRPILDGILAEIRAGTCPGVVVADVDRLSRAGVASALNLCDEIRAMGGTIGFAQLPYDTATPAGEMALTMFLALARMQWRQYQQGWFDARQRAIGRGVFIGPVPIGYDRQPDGTLAINEEDAEHVRRAFRISAGIKNFEAPDLPGARAVGTIGVPRDLHDVLDYLRGVFPDRHWSVTVAEKLIKQRLYVGEMRHGKELRKTFPELAIVDPMLWEFAQHERAVVRRTKLAPDFPLVGVATCGTCGAGLVAQKHGPEKTRRMRCINPACTGRAHCAAGPLEVMVLDLVRADPPTLSTDEMSQRNATRLAAESALKNTMATREHYEAADDLDRWTERVAECEAALSAARLAADATSMAPLPDLYGDLSTADLRTIFERAVGPLTDPGRGSLVVDNGRAPLADRVHYTPRA